MRRNRFTAALIGLAALFLATGAAGVDEPAGAEAPAAVTGPPVSSASEIDYPPFCIVDAEGRAGGFSVDLLRAALRAMGREVTFRIGPWAEVRGWLERGEVQALPLVGRTPERESLFDFTFPYMSLHGAIVVRRGTGGIQGLEDLRGRRVAVMKGDNAEEFLRREDLGIEIRATATFEEALRELAGGRHDAVVVQRLVALRLIQETGLTNLRVIDKPIVGFRQDFCFAVREGDKETLALLNEGLALVMADGTYRRLHARWFAALELPSHRRIVVGGDHNFPPFEYLDKNGRPAGFNVEITRAIAREVGLDLEIRLGPWAEVRQALEQGEIDALQGMLYSPQRDLAFDFTQPYTVTSYVSVVRKGEGPPPDTVEKLAGKRIVVQRGDLMHDFAVEKDLRQYLALVDAQEDALRELAGGLHDCALAARLTALYWIEKHGWENLVVARRPLVAAEYGYAVSENNKALLARFSEGLNILEETGEYRRIHKKWLGVYKKGAVTLLDALRYSAMVLIPLVVVLFLALLWSWSLRRRVARKTEELRESEKQYRILAENASDVIWVYSISQKTYTYVSPSVENLFGYTVEEAKAHDLEDHLPPESLERLRRAFGDARRQERPGAGSHAVEYEQVRKDGNKIWTEISFSFIRDDQGSPESILGITRDITERKRAEAELNRLLLAIEQAAEIIIITDPRGTVQYVNPAFERITGYSREEALGQNPRILKSGEQDQAFYRELWATISSGRTWQGRMVNRRKDETLFTEEAAISPVHDASGAIVNYVGVKLDITEELILEQQYRQAQKMEAVGRLAGGVAHDFNNMLNVILGRVEMALMKLEASDPLHDNLLEVRHAAERSARLTSQLLAFARKQTVEPRVLDLNETVEGMLKMLRRLMGEDIDLAWLPEAGLWPVQVDPAQVDQVLANLCVNARDAIDGVGKVTIETGNVVFDEGYCRSHAESRPGEHVMLAVSDTGCGMDRETKGHLFEPFFTTKGVGEGTGLGLATVYGIVKQSGGFIDVYSEPGRGTTFRIYVPRHPGGVEGVREESESPMLRGRGETVLLVEDEPAILELGRVMLEQLGYRVLAAGLPEEAVRLAGEHEGEIHLLVTDVVMPQMNGRELARRLRERRPELQCLFMSGYTANGITRHGVLEEGVQFIQKPFTMTALAVKVREALGEG